MRPIFTSLLLTSLLVLILSSCSKVNEDREVFVSLFEGGISRSLEIDEGTTVDQLLAAEQVSLGSLDRVEPSLSTVLFGGESIRIIRVREEFSIVESVLPFEQQTIKNESLPEGQSVLIQSGVNGISQTTHRILIEDGIEVSRRVLSTEVLQPAKPEILMIGVQSPFSAISIEGTIAYISASNAWVMDITTANRKIVVSTGDLDGRIF